MRFESATGSIIGSAHQRAGRNGQDGFAIVRDDTTIAAVVTDGCGSAPHSEVGAKIGAVIAARALLSLPHELAMDAIVDQLRAIARPLHTHDFFLFTIVAAIVRPDRTMIVSAGDGLFACNGRMRVIGPYPGNAPPYIGYALREGAPPRWDVQLDVPTAGLETLLIGTDGAQPASDHFPSFFSDDVVFRNPDGMRRRLYVLSRREGARLEDDATVALLRRAS